MRARNKNGTFTGSLNEDEIRRFRERWPASNLDGLRRVAFEFDKRNGDLVDVRCNGRSGCERFDGEALSALSRDVECLAAKHLRRKGVNGSAGLTPSGAHCGETDLRWFYRTYRT